MSATEKVYNYLKSGKSISVRECIDIFGTTELRKIISRLSKRGIKLKSWYVEGVTHLGDVCRYKRYALMEDEDVNKAV